MDIKEAVEYLKIKNRVTKQQIESGELWLDTIVEAEQKDIEAIETVLAELEKKDTEISALKMEHEYDLKMIDEVKGEAVKLYNEIEQLKIAGNGMDLLLKQQTDETQQVLNDYQELGKDYHHLECELEKKEKIIDELVKTTVKLKETSNEDCFIPRSYREINECIKTTCENCIKEYFKKKVEG